MSKPLVLLYCGSFSPISVAHLRSIEVGKNYLEKQGYTVTVIISPVGDAYKKKDLLPAAQRIEILQLAAKNSDYIQVSDWESKREEYTRTLLVLQHFSEENPGVPVRLLCGSDLLESFNMPGVWADEDVMIINEFNFLVRIINNHLQMEAIVKDFGLIVLTRGDNIDSTIEACKHLANYKVLMV